MKPISMKHIILLIVAVLLPCSSAWAAHADYRKMSSLLRQLTVNAQSQREGKQAVRSLRRNVCAFVKTRGDAESVLPPYGAKVLMQQGDVSIALLPVARLASMSLDDRIIRMEAGRGKELLMDSTAMHVDALPVYAGTDLQQAYTGSGVVVGVMDVGFDLTHPNFYDSTAVNYRIKAFWDQLAEEESTLPVGADFTTEEALLAHAHSRDGLVETHGTHTLGIAAGSGYNSKYRGMAYESDICLVSNAITADTAFIDDEDLDLYTYAMDVLGFKYIFDYADSQGQPCVISFSEGSSQDFRGDDVLFYEMIDSLLGPGHILVASAGNSGQKKTYFLKEAAEPSKGAFLYSTSKGYYCTMKSADDFTVRLVVYGTSANDTLLISTASVRASADSLLRDTVTVAGGDLVYLVQGYPSCYNENEMCYDLQLAAPSKIGSSTTISLEVVSDADVEFYLVSGYLTANSRNGSLNAGQCTHSIHSPSSSPSVICVGNTAYRTGFTNYQGEYKNYNGGTGGVRHASSSVGPTYDGRVKPDVMAPGTNIISSYSSYYLENNPTAGDISSDVEHFEFGGRTYAWNSNSGTSMSTPVVAGGIALWLQACPTLTTEQVMEVIAATSTHYDETLEYPNNEYGYGQIDVYQGLLYVLSLTDKIEGLSVSQPSGIRFGVSEGMVSLQLARAASHDLSVRVYDLSGVQVYSSSLVAGNDRYSLDLSRLPHGVYAVQVNAADAALTGSTLIRR